MAEEDVTVKVSADIAQALEGWRKINDGPAALRDALQRLGDQEQKTSRGWASNLAGVVGQWASIGAAINVARVALGQYVEMRRRLREEENQATNTIDDLANRFYVQGGIKGTDQERFRKQILAVTAQRKVDTQTGFTVATQLVSSGVTPDQAAFGGALDEVLQLLSTTNASGANVDPQQITKALVQWLTANGLKPTRENVRSQAVALQRLFAGTNIQLAELTQFAPAAATVRKFAGVRPEESLAIVSQFLDLTDIENSATAFRTAVTRLATGGANTEVQRGLSMIGLKPEDVDFQGESFQTVVQRLTDRLQQTEGAKRNAAARLIFSRAGLPFYTTITEPGALEETRRRIALTADEAGYRETLAIAESGRGAGARQAKTAAEGTLYTEGVVDPEVVRNRIIAEAGKAGFTDAQTASVLRAFEHPAGPVAAIPGIGSYIEGFYLPEDRARVAAERLAQINASANHQPYTHQQVTHYVRILTNDGRDFPIQSEGEALNQDVSTDATQSSNFRP